MRSCCFVGVLLAVSVLVIVRSASGEMSTSHTSRQPPPPSSESPPKPPRSPPRLPENLEKLINAIRGVFNESDCRALVDPRQPTMCDSMMGNFTGTQLIEALADFIKTSFSSRNTNILFLKLTILCKMGDVYDGCMKKFGKVCNKFKQSNDYFRYQKLTNPMFSAMKDICTKSGTLKPNYRNIKNDVSLSTCLDDAQKLADVNNAFDLLINSIRRSKGTLEDKLPPPIPGEANSTVNTPSGTELPSRNAEDDRVIKKLCKVFGDFKKRLNMALASCNSNTKMMFQKMSQLLLPPELADKCRLPSDDPSELDGDINTANKVRKTVFIFGGSNKAHINATSLQTCAYSEGENVTLFELEQLKLQCTVGVIGSTFTYLKDCSLDLYDDKRNMIDSMEFLSKLAKMPLRFKKLDGLEIKPENSKGAGKPKKSIKVKRDADDKITYTDLNLGVAVKLFMFKSSNNTVCWNAALRVSEKAFERATGILTRDCMTEVTRPSSRRKRETKISPTSASNYDKNGFNDPNAGSISTTMEQEIQSLENLDSSILSALAPNAAARLQIVVPWVSFAAAIMMAIFQMF